MRIEVNRAPSPSDRRRLVWLGVRTVALGAVADRKWQCIWLALGAAGGIAGYACRASLLGALVGAGTVLVAVPLAVALLLVPASWVNVMSTCRRPGREMWLLTVHRSSGRPVEMRVTLIEPDPPSCAAWTIRDLGAWPMRTGVLTETGGQLREMLAARGVSVAEGTATNRKVMRYYERTLGAECLQPHAVMPRLRIDLSPERACSKEMGGS